MEATHPHTAIPEVPRVPGSNLHFEEDTNYGWVLVMPATMFALVLSMIWLGIALR